MEYFNIELDLPKELKDKLISIGLTTDSTRIYNHLSSTSNKQTNLDFIFAAKIYKLCLPLISIFSIKPKNISIVRILPGMLVDWHVDDPKFKRQTVIIFPLLPSLGEYAECETENGKIDPTSCYAFNTNVRHKVQNNNQLRLSLQLFFDKDIEQLSLFYKENKLFVNKI